uniref:Uncharacterized protein n=1 Tax=Oryza meridionalis TaxID=40149 RepID=A0A0E0CFB1_9ORYZ
MLSHAREALSKESPRAHGPRTPLAHSFQTLIIPLDTSATARDSRQPTLELRGAASAKAEDSAASASKIASVPIGFSPLSISPIENSPTDSDSSFSVHRSPMSFRRRFVYLVVGACHSRRAVLDVCHTPAATFRLHRINMSLFFAAADAGAMVDVRLPRHAMSFYAPSSSSEEEHYDGRMQFMLLGRDRVLATDQTGRAAIYAATAHATRTAPAFTKPKNDPVSVAVGNDALYVLDTSARPEEPCFEALIYDRGGLRTGTWRTDYYDNWRCHPLPPRPFPGAYLDAVGAYTVVGGSDIWMSTKDDCTYSFDTARRAWAKQGDWTLPFQGLAEFVPEYNLWFGLSSTKNNHLCAFDLAGAAQCLGRPQATQGVEAGEILPGAPRIRQIRVSEIMSLRRRFVYLVLDGRCKRRASLDAYMPVTYHLHRINTSRFFYPGSPPPAAAAVEMVDARLPPRPCMTFYGPSADNSTGSMDFSLFGRDRDMVLAADQKGRATIYDPVSNAVRAAPALAKPKKLPSVSVAVGDSLYVLDPTRSDEHSFQALVYKPGGGGGGGGATDWYNDWHCRSLPPPPYEPYSCSFVGAHGAIGACAVVGGGDIWVSTNGAGTFSFDTARRVWAKQGEWSLPFRGHAEYVPEYNLWFGLSSTKNSHLCAFDLAGAAKRRSPSSPPAPRNVWEDLKPPKEWEPSTSFLVHLGSGRFCIARFFHKHLKVSCCDMEIERYAVFSGVEVGKAGRGLRMVKHRSECYRLDDILCQWVL